MNKQFSGLLKTVSLMVVTITLFACLQSIAKEGDYALGLKQLDNKDYAAAQQTFRALISEDNNNNDAALYWLSYAYFKSNDLSNALKSISSMESRYPNSRWLDDAHVLRNEIQDKRGENVEIDGDQLKLYALNSLLNSPSDKSIKLLQDILSGDSSEQVKGRALFILSQTSNPEAFEIIAKFAADDTSEKLQGDAIEMLAISRTPAALNLLKNIYAQSKSDKIKIKVLNSYMLMNDSVQIIELVKSETNPQIRHKAIQLVGIMSKADGLLLMYRDNHFASDRHEILQSIAISGNLETLLTVIESEKNNQLLSKAVEQLGILSKTNSGPALNQLYQQKNNKLVRKAVITAMFIQSNATGLIDIIKTEDDPELKRAAVQKLSLIDSDEAKTYFKSVLESEG